MTTQDTIARMKKALAQGRMIYYTGRTAGIGKTKKEISKDLNFLTTQWNKIREKTLKSAAPTIIYEEGSILKRTIRDMLKNDVGEVHIEGKEGYEDEKEG